MRPAAIVAAALALNAGPASAVSGVLGPASDAKACFERSYDSAHLARTPGQSVTRIRISVSREGIPGGDGGRRVAFLRVELTRRGEAQAQRAIAWCEHPFGGEKVDARGRVTNLGGPGARCRLTGEDHMNAEEGNDGGAVDVRAAGGGLHARLSSPLRLRVGDQVSVDKGRAIRLGQADRIFLLRSVPASACDGLRRAIREE